MKHFHFSFLLALLMSMVGAKASAYDAEIDGIYYNFSGTEATVVRGPNIYSYSGNVTIPKSVVISGTTRSVTSIGTDAFSGCSGLTSVTIPNSVTSIGGFAFQDCRGLTSVTIPSSVTSIGYGAFSGCSGLTSVTIPSSVTSIGSSVFAGCSGLTSVTIPGSVTSISDYAFNKCTGLTSITIPSSVTSIGKHAFEYCTGLTSVTIPESVTSIGDYAFSRCRGLTSVTIPNSVTDIGDYAFYHCSGLTSITIPSSVTYIRDYAFASCIGLKDFYYKATTRPSLGESPFYNCSLDKATLHVPVTAIEIYKNIAPWNTFGKIVAMVYTITYFVDGQIYKRLELLPECVITPEPAPIKEGYTFSGWSEIPEIMPDEDVTVTGSFTINNYTLTYVVDGEIYKTLSVDYGTALTAEPAPIKEGYTFSGWSGLPETMPAHDVIVTGTFTVNQYTLTYVVDGETYKTLSVDYGTTLTAEPAPVKEGYTFSGWNGLPETMPAHDVTVTGSFTLVNGDFLVDGINYHVVATDKTATVISKAPQYTGDVVIPASIVVEDTTFTVTGIADDAFYDCRGLTSVQIPDDVKTIGGSAFYGCRALTTFSLGKGVTSIGAYAFYGCNHLATLIIPASVTDFGLPAVGEEAFYGCTALKDVYCYAESVPSAGNYSFYTSLSAININAVTLHVPVAAYEAYRAAVPWKQFGHIVPIMEGSFAWELDGISYRLDADHMAATITGATPSESGHVVIPASVEAYDTPFAVTAIGDGALSACEGLKLIVASQTTPITASTTAFASGTLAIVPRTALAAYQSAAGWMKLNFITNTFLCTETTQTTATLQAKYDCLASMSVVLGENTYTPVDGIVRITGLSPNKTYTVTTQGEYGGVQTGGGLTVTTKTVVPSTTVIGTTNVTATLQGEYEAGDATISESGWEDYGSGDEMTVTDLAPGEHYNFTYYVVCSDGSRFTKQTQVQTVPVGLSVTATPRATGCTVEGTYDVIDATVEDAGFEGFPQQTTLELHGLDPQTTYTQTFYVETHEGGVVKKTVSYRTEAISMQTAEPKVATPGNVVVAAETNLDDEETTVGFEWRRTDWPDDFKSNTGAANLYEGVMEGYIRNLNTDKLWRYRPYYISATGNSYYGEWIGIDPTNTSYFEPTVHTYAQIAVDGNTVQVQGYALRGSDVVTMQGFVYWQVTASQAVKGQHRAPGIPSDATKVEASGNVMEALLRGLKYETDYCYAAFVTTSEGETFYGDVRTFTTGERVVKVEEIDNSTISPSDDSAGAVYDMNGRRLAKPQKGIHIVRSADGSVRKIVKR